MRNETGPQILIRVFEGSRKIYESTFDDFPISFGRGKNNLVRLPSDNISRTHCMVVEERGRFFLIDLNSSNGILVDNRKVEKAEITDKIKFDVVEFTIEVELVIKKPVAAHHGIPRSVSSHQGDTTASIAANVSDLIEVPVLEKDFRHEFLGPHHGLSQARSRRLEAIVMWHDVVYDVKMFEPGETIVVGPRGEANVPIDALRGATTLARFHGGETECYVQLDHNVSLMRDRQVLTMHDLMAHNLLHESRRGYTLHFVPGDVASFQLGSGINLVLRYVPGMTPLSTASAIEPDEALKQSLFASTFLHLFLAVIVWLSAPPVKDIPKLNNVPERYARLLVQPPKPKPTPPPPPKKEEPPKVVKKPKPKPKKEEKIVIKRPPPKIKTPKVLAKKNKYPIEVEHPMPKVPPPVKVEAIGALGALGAISKNAPSNVVSNININPNAGGMQTKSINTGGIVGALPSSNGKLVAAGGASVKTKGLGYGTGTGYGIQGLKGAAGRRGVAGAVVGAPKLAVIGREEGLTRAQVMAVVQKYLGEVQHCYEKNLLLNPDLAGRMEFEWDIAASGQVTDVRVKRSTVKEGDALGECVKGVFGSMKFPAAKNGLITTPNIGFPFGRL